MTVVIGSQTDVPNVGDPIVSPWYQDTARKIVHVFASTAARDAWVSPPDGAVCQAPAGTWWNRVAGAWVPMGGYIRRGSVPAGTAPPGGTLAGAAQLLNVPVGTHLVAYTVLLTSTAGLSVDLKLFANGNVFFLYQIRTADVNRSVSFSVPVVLGGPASLTVNVDNLGAGNVSCYADALNHSFAATQSS